MRTCPVDGVKFQGRADRVYCSERCSKAARRAGVTPLRSPDNKSDSGLVSAVRSELERAGRESTGLGASALLLAARIDGGQEPGAALAALNRELRATLAEALRGESSSSVAAMRDELAERRARA